MLLHWLGPLPYGRAYLLLGRLHPCIHASIHACMRRPPCLLRKPAPAAARWAACSRRLGWMAWRRRSSCRCAKAAKAACSMGGEQSDARLAIAEPSLPWRPGHMACLGAVKFLAAWDGDAGRSWDRPPALHASMAISWRPWLPAWLSRSRSGAGLCMGPCRRTGAWAACRGRTTA